jgi:4-hydroxybenzoyl-CoA thioesterase
MARVRLPQIKNIDFSTELTVHVEHLNYGGHVGNDKFLSLAHEARVRFLEALGGSELDFDGVGLIMTDAQIMYKAEVFRAERLCVDMGVEEFMKSRFELHYRITRLEDGKEVARIQTGMAFFDYTERVLAMAPQSFETKFKERQIS